MPQTRTRCTTEVVRRSWKKSMAGLLPLRDRPIAFLFTPKMSPLSGNGITLRQVSGNVTTAPRFTVSNAMIFFRSRCDARVRAFLPSTSAVRLLHLRADSHP